MSTVNSKIVIALIILSIMSFLANLGFLIYIGRPNVTIQVIQPVSKEAEVPLPEAKEFE